MSTTADKPYDLFVSYGDADRAWVEGYLLDALTQAGVHCHSEATLRLGVPRLEEFERAVRQSTRVLLVFSSAASFEGFTPFLEVLAQSYGAAAAEWPVIPLLRAPVNLPTRLAMLTRLDATDPAAWPEVVARLCRELQQPVPGPAPRPDCPYPGMVPFGPKEAGYFFGREEEIERGIQHLRHQRTLFVIGPSGSGKSSLIYAGLLPRLAQSSLFPPGYWVVRALRPGAAPMRALAEALGADPNQPGQAVAGVLARHAPGQRLLVLVDQLEELFTQTRDYTVQCQFLGALKGLRAVEQCALLVGMRADFYADLMNSDLWPVDPGQRLEISPLRGEALRQAIKRPAAEVGVQLEAGLVERLLADASDEPGVLPLLQETMVLLWDKMERRLIPYHAYEHLGQGGRSGLAVAMATKADATLAELTAPQQQIARRVLLRLVQFGEGRADTRRQQRLTELRSAKDDPAEFDRALEHLTRHRLLTRGGEDDREDPVVDIAHEMLLIGWPRCQDWVQSRREAEQVRRRLEAKSKEWTRLGRGGGGLLDAVGLAEAERWLASADAADLGYDQDLAALVAASRTRQDAERALARRRTRNTIAGLAAGLLLVTGLAVWAAYSAWRAGQEEANARKAEGDARKAEGEARKAEGDARKAEGVANERRQEAERLRQLAVTQALVAQAAHQHTHGKRDERGALLARQAFLFNQRLRGPLLAEVDEALRVVLRDPYSSTVVPLGAVEANITVMAFDPGHRQLAWADVDGVLRVWDLHRPQDGPRLLRGHDKIVSALAFSRPDGRWLASGSHDHTVRLWDLRQASPAATPLPGGHKGIVAGLAFSPNGLSLASGSNDQTVRVWDLSRPQAGPRVLASKGLARALAFSDDGGRLAWGSYNGIDAGSAETWNPRQPDLAPVALPYKGGPIFAVAFSRDGRRLAAGSYSGRIILWDFRETPLAPSYAGEFTAANLEALQFSPDGQQLATAGATGVHVVDVNRLIARLKAAPKPLPKLPPKPLPKPQPGAGLEKASFVNPAADWVTTLVGHEGRVQAVAFSADGRQLVSSSLDRTVRRWRLDVPRVDPVVLHGRGQFVSLAFALDGRRLALGASHHAAQVQDLSRLEETVPGWHDPEGPRGFPPKGSVPGGLAWTTAFSADLGRVAFGTADHVVRLWDLSRPNDAPTLLTDPDRESLPPGTLARTSVPVAFSRDARWLASGGQDGKVRVWDLRQPGARPTILPCSGEPVLAVAFCPDSQRLAAGGRDGAVRVWDVSRLNAPPALLRGHTAAVWSVAFSPKGGTLASGSSDRTVHLWELARPDAAPVVLRGHDNLVLAVAFSPDGRTLASGGADRHVYLWRPEAPSAPPVVLRGHEWSVGSLAFSPDGRRLASGDYGFSVRVWAVNTAELADMVCQRVGRNLTVEEWRQFVGEGIPYERTCPDLPAAKGVP